MFVKWYQFRSEVSVFVWGVGGRGSSGTSDLICILFIGSPIETAVNLSGFTFQGYPLNLDVCK